MKKNGTKGFWSHPNWAGVGVIIGIVATVVVAIIMFIYTSKQNEANFKVVTTQNSDPIAIGTGGYAASRGGVLLVIRNGGPSTGNAVYVSIHSSKPITSCDAVDQKDSFFQNTQPTPKITSSMYQCELYYENFYVNLTSMIQISRDEDVPNDPEVVIRGKNVPLP